MKFCEHVKCILDQKGHHVWSVHPDDSVYKALEIMADKHIGAVLVQDGDGKLVGVMSETDYARKVALKSRSSRETLVREIMTKSLITGQQSDSVDECVRLMHNNHVRHLPILEGNRLVGVLSESDLVGWIVRAQDAAIEQLEHYIVGTYPG